MPSLEMRIIPVTGMPEVEAGADIGALIVDAASAQGTAIEPRDVVVVAQKIVSKAEGRIVRPTRARKREPLRSEKRNGSCARRRIT
jgi:F420-0:gamma-glutamyl ligase